MLLNFRAQKEELAQQLQAQGVACLASDTDGSTLEGVEEDWTLEEVDIDGSMQMDEQVNVLPMEGVASDIGQTAATLAWAPPWGSGWGTDVGSHLRTDLGSALTVGAKRDTVVQPQVSDLSMDRANFNIGPANSAWKPMDSWGIPGDLRTTVGPGFISGARRDPGVPAQGSSVSFDKADLNIGPAKSAWKPPGSLDIPGDLRTNVGSGFISGAQRDFECQQERRLLQECEMGEVVRFSEFGHVGSSSGVLKLADDAQQIWQNPSSFDRMTASSLGYGTMGSHTDESASQGAVRLGPGENESFGWSVGLGNDNGDMVRKVQEYRERALERQASMDAETLSKVRAYQHQLLQTYEDKKKYLADIRADIEKRQQELSTAASSKPAFSIQSIQVKQPVADKWGNPTGNSQTVSAGQKMVPSGTGESNVGESFNDRKNVQMHETTKASLPTSLSAHYVGHGADKGSGAENVCHKVSSTCMVAGQQKIIKSASLRDNRGGGEKYNIDTVRKSLSFDEECMMSGHRPWKGVADADTSNCSHASTDDSRLISSEEERGSPVLPQGHLEVSEKSQTLPQDRPYVYGSALLAQAQERKLGFEHRQMELQNQLLDIQRQKDAIMQAYYTGQSALQHREETLMSKMATASALLNMDSSEKQRVEVRAKLASIRSQIDTDARSRTATQENRSGNTSIDVTQGKESRSDTNANYNVPPQPTDSLNESTDIDRTSSRQSLGNISMPGNTSSDSYLAEISFHKIRSDDGRSLPSSAFHVPVPSSAASIPVSRSLTQNHQQQPQTWASILSTSAHGQQQSLGRQQDSLQNDRLGSQNEVNAGNLSSTSHLEQQKATTNQRKDFQNTTSLAAHVVESGSYELEHQCTSSPMLCGVTSHQLHELSTILEVDTPGSVSAVTSGRKLVTSSEQSTGTSDPINSMPFQAWNLPRASAGVLVDVFADLPYTFQETRATSVGSGAVFHLKPDHKLDEASRDSSEPGLRMDSSVSCGQKQSTAKRSLDFSDNSHVSTLPALVEFAQYRASDIQVPGMKGIEQIKSDTDRTPGQDASVGEDSSLKISGFSEYLRSEESSGANVVDEWTGLSALSTSTSHVDAAGNIGSCAASEDKATDRPDMFCSVPHGHSFDAKTVERLQQQARAVFGDVVAGEGSHETSVGSLLCSSLSCDLEEVSIPEAGH